MENLFNEEVEKAMKKRDRVALENFIEAGEQFIKEDKIRIAEAFMDIQRLSGYVKEYKKTIYKINQYIVDHFKDGK